jgi:DNA primase
VPPAPIRALAGAAAGRRAALRACRLALPHLSPGQSLRFVFLPSGEDPDSFVRRHGAESMRALLAKAEPLAETLWNSETQDRDFSTPERRAGLEAVLAELVKAIRDTKVADYYRREFADRVFKAFKQRRPFSSGKGRPGPMRSAPGRSPRGRRGDAPHPSVQPSVSIAVKRSLHAVNSLSAAKSLTERRLIGLLLEAPHLIERYSEALAWLTLDDPQLDRIRKELLNVAASGRSLDKTFVEGHLVREGLGALAERLRTQSVLQSDLRGQADDEAREALLLRTKAQLADPEISGVDELLKAKRDEALRRYLEGGLNTDWEELQGLQAEIRKFRDPEAESGH